MFPQASRMLPAVAKSRMQIHRGHRPVVAPFTVDPVPAMRRELKLLRIEVEQLRAVERIMGIELDLLRGLKDEARQSILECFERIEQVRESRDWWEQEAGRLSALIAQKPGAIVTAIRLHGRRAENEAKAASPRALAQVAALSL